MGEVDIAKEHPNVVRMRLLGAQVVPVGFGGRTLKEAVDSAFVSRITSYNVCYTKLLRAEQPEGERRRQGEARPRRERAALLEPGRIRKNFV